MNKNSVGKSSKIPLFIIALLASAFLLYKYSYRIPVLKEIPFFSNRHEHIYKPVFNEEGEIDYWTCTMHPAVKLKEPGKCPICSMDLVPVMNRTSDQSESREKTEEMKDMESMNMDDNTAGTMQHMHGMSGMPGMDNMGGMNTGKENTSKKTSSTFMVSPERQQIIGVKTEPVIKREMTKVIRTVGIVELDETKVQHIHTKFSGWIDKVYADYTWKHVNKGDPLFSIYSPELVSTQEEYLLALKSKNILSGIEFPEISEGAYSLVESTRRRLRLWDISESQINELERTGKVSKSLVIYSPIQGHIMNKNAFENMYVEPDTTIYTIADHSSVWVNAELYENEIGLVKLGQQASITVDSLPGEVFKGKATFIKPHLSAKTRTIIARFEFNNPDLKLLPEMYADVNIEIPMGTRLTIPSTAVLRTGKQDIVIVDKGEGNMELRLVELGQKSDDFYEILKGLQEGEKVVSRANFLIDSESKVQAAIATWQDDTELNKESSEQKDLIDTGSGIDDEDKINDFNNHTGH